MTSREAQFRIGQLIKHRRFGYRGVIADVDPVFAQSEAWYEAMAVTRPPKDRPWYHVLVHQATHWTYVAERNLEADASGEPVVHPEVALVFAGFADGAYLRRTRSN